MTTSTSSFKTRRRRTDATQFIAVEQLRDLQNLFRLLGSETRLRLLHILMNGDRFCVSDLADAVEMKPQAVSNQLQRLADQGVIGRRREGNNIYYWLDDPCVAEILDRAICLLREKRK